MRRTVCCSLVIGALALATPAGAQERVRPAETFQPVVTSSPTIQASLARIAEGSASWRDAIDAVRQAGRRVLLLTPDQVVVADAPGGVATGEFDPAVLAEVAPVLNADSSVDVVLIVVNLPLLEESHRLVRSVPSAFEADLDRILVHEIYGHAVPYLLVGHLSGRCPDPVPGERATEACSIRRENAVRAELGLGRRTTYGLDDLNVSRRTKR